MASLPPNTQEDLMRASTVNMAVAQPTKSKAASKQANNNANTKAKTQMHRRSRTGCYTCRLRRKKCDEGTPMCTACKHLGLVCEYKRPMWWSNNDARRQHKDDIKMIIKRKKLSEKASHSIQTSVSSPPSLSHSLPTSATFTDPLDRTRSASIDSHFNFNSPPHVSEYGAYNPHILPSHADFMFNMSPYEIDVKTERQMFVNDVPTLRESTVSTFSTYHTPPPPGSVLSSYPMDGGEWPEELCHASLTEEALNYRFFDFSNGLATNTSQVDIELEESDQRLLDHFIRFVLPTIFPILETNQHGSVGSDLILPALQNNKGYLHCCLMIAAQHLKAATNSQGEEIDNDIMRNRHATILALCEALNEDENHHQILEATLGLIFFQSCVGRYDDSLPDIPWHQHFQAVQSLVEKLDLPRLVSDEAEPLPQTPFNMTLTAWIDILGATMQGRAPSFAHAYREKHLSTTNPSLGLRELMGCDDHVMYLISEIACLEALKKEGMDDITLCQHVHSLGGQIGLTETHDCGPKMPFNANGSLSPKQLSKNITSAFRLAARIYLCSLVPGFSPSQDSCVGLVEKLTTVLHFIPSGPGGFDRSLAWVYLIGGSVSGMNSSFRQFFHERIAQLGDAASYGSFGGVVTLLHEVWQQADNSQPSPSANGSTEAPYVSWRDVMQMRGWDYLLI
ncbi:PRO1 protein [Durotheca rogersii]|uniref:PRO1 protein n=1 Tax=Durotheca rogersii TaxID=419775 RepID=UPI00221EEF8C|nr:PRO1 protein [Durotheca rogersii]KAI5861773.1 PRO1 protein [Durotheca rogersii]